MFMKKQKYFIAFLFFIIICSISIIFYWKTGVNAVIKTYNSENHYATLVFNGIEYYSLKSYPRYITNDQESIQTSFSVEEFYPYQLLEVNRVAIEELFDRLPTLKNGYHYYTNEKYYIFENDSKVIPSIIFEKNTLPGGPSDGWYYVSKDFKFDMPTIEDDGIVAFVVYDNSWNEIKKITDEVQIKNIVQNIKFTSDLSTILNISEANWKLYAVYLNCPFSQAIAVSNQGTVSVNESIRQSGDSSMIDDVLKS